MPRRRSPTKSQAQRISESKAKLPKDAPKRDKRLRAAEKKADEALKAQIKTAEANSEARMAHNATRSGSDAQIDAERIWNVAHWRDMAAIARLDAAEAELYRLQALPKSPRKLKALEAGQTLGQASTLGTQPIDAKERGKIKSFWDKISGHKEKQAESKKKIRGHKKQEKEYTKKLEVALKAQAKAQKAAEKAAKAETKAIKAVRKEAAKKGEAAPPKTFSKESVRQKLWKGEALTPQEKALATRLKLKPPTEASLKKREIRLIERGAPPVAHKTAGRALLELEPPPASATKKEREAYRKAHTKATATNLKALKKDSETAEKGVKAAEEDLAKVKMGKERIILERNLRKAQLQATTASRAVLSAETTAEWHAKRFARERKAAEAKPTKPKPPTATQRKKAAQKELQAASSAAGGELSRLRVPLRSAPAAEQAKYAKAHAAAYAKYVKALESDAKKADEVLKAAEKKLKTGTAAEKATAQATLSTIRFTRDFLVKAAPQEQERAAKKAARLEKITEKARAKEEKATAKPTKAKPKKAKAKKKKKAPVKPTTRKPKKRKAKKKKKKTVKKTTRKPKKLSDAQRIEAIRAIKSSHKRKAAIAKEAKRLHDIKFPHDRPKPKTKAERRAFVNDPGTGPFEKAIKGKL